MQIKTQPIKEAIEIKSSGIAFDVYNNGAKRIGDLAITKNGLVWSNGSAQRTKGVTVKWDQFINWMQSQTQTKTKTPARAPQQSRTLTQPRARTLTPSQTRTAPKTKAAAKPGSAIAAKKPAIKITASAKTARKKAH